MCLHTSMHTETHTQIGQQRAPVEAPLARASSMDFSACSRSFRCISSPLSTPALPCSSPPARTLPPPSAAATPPAPASCPALSRQPDQAPLPTCPPFSPPSALPSLNATPSATAPLDGPFATPAPRRKAMAGRVAGSSLPLILSSLPLPLPPPLPSPAAASPCLTSSFCVSAAWSTQALLPGSAGGGMCGNGGAVRTVPPTPVATPEESAPLFSGSFEAVSGACAMRSLLASSCDTIRTNKTRHRIRALTSAHKLHLFLESTSRTLYTIDWCR